MIAQMTRFALPALFLLLLPSWGFATAMTLEECIAKAMVDNPQIKAYQSAIKEAEAGIGEAWGTFLPTLSFSYDYTELLDSSGNGSDADYFDQQSDRFTAKISQPLFSGLSSVAGLKKARQNKEYRERELQYIKAQLVREVRSIFYDLLYARQLVGKRAESVQRLEQQSRVAEAWVKQSMAPRVRLLEVQVVLSNAKQDLIAAETKLAIAEARLEELLALERNSQIDISGDLQQENTDSCTDLDACVDRALSQRIELDLTELNIQMARQDARAIVSRNLPRANLDATWTDYQRDYENSLQIDDARDYYSVFLNISIQPFQGGRNIFAWRRQRAAIERLIHQKEKQRNIIVTEVRTRYEQLRESQARLVTAQDGLTQAQEAYKLMSRSVELGVNSVRDLLDSGVLLTRAEINQIDTFNALQQARTQFEYALGN